MTAYFKKNSNIDHIDVNGNGESIYFALDEANKLIGMNKVECSNMIISFVLSQLDLSLIHI